MKRIIILIILSSLLVSGLGYLGYLPVQAASSGSGLYQEAETPTATGTGSETVEGTATATDTIEPGVTETIANTPTSSNPAATAENPTATNNNSNNYSQPLINMVSSSYDPAMAYIGNIFTLTVVIKNVGQRTAYNIVVTFSSSDLQTQSNGGVMMVSSLDAGAKKTISQDFLIITSINTYQPNINVQVSYKDKNGSPYSQSFTTGVSVYWNFNPTPTPSATPIGKPQMIVNAYSVGRSILVPGCNFTLTMNVVNKGIFSAYDVSLTMNSSSGTAGSTSTTNFLPIGSSNVLALGNIGPKQEIQLQQDFVVNSSTTPGAIPLTIDFTYSDESGAPITDEQVITLLVYLVPSIEISFYEQVSTLTVGQQGTLPLQVINLSGDSVLLGDLTVTVESGTLTNSEMFVGALDGGGSFTFDTEIVPSKAGQQTASVQVTYQDNFGNTKTIAKDLDITVEQEAAGTLTPLQATQEALRGTTSRTAQAGGSETIWQIILRIIKGLIGFDSGPVRTATQVFRGSSSFNNFFRTATPQQ